MNRRFALLVVLLVAAILRLLALDRYPPSLHIDEAARGYDAWCLLETGADRHGQPWPFFLKSFGPGDYTAALSTYLTVPFVALLGHTQTAIRLPDAILGVLTVLLIFLWLQNGMGYWPALIAAAMLATDPWHVGLTRTAHESGLAPFFLVLGMYGLSRAGVIPWPCHRNASHEDEDARNQETGAEGIGPAFWAFLGAGNLCMAAWVYPATRLVTPILCLATLIFFWRRICEVSRRKEILAGLLGGLIIGGAPLWITAWTHPEYLAARAPVVLILTSGNLIAISRSFLENYASNLSPRNLFLSTDEMSSAALPGLGQHLPIWAPLMIFGLWMAIRTAGQNRWARLLLVWLLIYPLPAALCRDWNPHPMRCIAGIPLFAVITAWGAAFVVDRFSNILRSRMIIAGYATLISINLVYAVQRYLHLMKEPTVGYQTTLVRALEFAAHRSNQLDFVLVTNRANQPYVYVLLAEPISPTTLAKAKIDSIPGTLGFDQVIRLDKYFFLPAWPKNVDESRRQFASCWSEIKPGSRGLIIRTAEEESLGQVISSFHSEASLNRAPTYIVSEWVKQ